MKRRSPVEHVKPTRSGNNRKARAEKWWRHGEARPGLRAKLAGLQRYIATPETAKHRFFVSLPLGDLWSIENIERYSEGKSRSDC